jgi:hypothetical protein
VRQDGEHEPQVGVIIQTFAPSNEINDPEGAPLVGRARFEVVGGNLLDAQVLEPFDRRAAVFLEVFERHDGPRRAMDAR